MTTQFVQDVLDALDQTSTHRDVERLLRTRSWKPCGAGDWAFALRGPGSDIVARVSPFDPVGPYTARLYSDAAPTGQVPHLFAHRRLAGGGDLQLMERLYPVPEAVAVEFLRRFNAPDPELAALAEIVAHIHRDARDSLPWCGPLDQNPSNVMRNGNGHLVLTDPYYADGPDLYATAERDPHRVAALIPEDQRRHMTEIPLTESGPWETDERAALREKLRRADADRASARDEARGSS